MYLIGVDPGASGGIAIIRNDGSVYSVTSFSKLTDHDIWETFRTVPSVLEFAVLEKVHAMPKQGVSSTFKFGRSFGMLEGFLIASCIPYELVPPGTWQKKLGCLSKGDKNATKAAAQRLFPGHKITHAVADALLIAEYARRIWHERYVCG